MTEPVKSIDEIVKMAKHVCPLPTCDLASEQKKYDCMYLAMTPECATSESNSRELTLFKNFNVHLWPRRIFSPVLCAGGGPGTGMRKLLEWGFDAFSCDISQVAAQYYADCIERFSCCPLHKMPYAKKWFSMTVCADVLEHVPTTRVEESLAELIRVTKNVLLVAVATAPSEGILGMHLTVWDKQKWEDVLKQYGSVSVAAHAEKCAAFLVEVQ